MRLSQKPEMSFRYIEMQVLSLMYHIFVVLFFVFSNTFIYVFTRFLWGNINESSLRQKELNVPDFDVLLFVVQLVNWPTVSFFVTGNK